MDERYIELMNKEIDGLNTPSESHELQTYLDGNRDAKEYFEGLQRTANALQGVEEQEPPSYLRNHILNSIKFAATATTTRSDWVGRLVETVQSRSFRRYSLVFASGLCIGVLFFVLANPWRENVEDTSKLSGSMALFPDLSSLKMIDSILVGGEGVEGVFRTYRTEGRIFVETELKSPDRLRVELNSDPAELAFGSIVRIAGTEGDVNVTQGRIMFTGLKSDRSIVTFVDVGQARRPIEGRIYKDGSVVQSVVLRTQ